MIRGRRLVSIFSRRSEAAAGFVLIGVVMLVLALTILGLSLFGLSSYEAQFIRASSDEAQALAAAEGGLERAKYALAIKLPPPAQPNDLSQVRDALPLEFVTSVVAKQWQDTYHDSVTSGPLEWDTGQKVRITVTAEVNGVKKTVYGEFLPQKANNYYKHLITTLGPDTVIIAEPDIDGPGFPNDRLKTIWLSGLSEGLVWQREADVSWANNVNFNPPRSPATIIQPPVPVPDVAGFFARHTAGAPAPPSGKTFTFPLSGDPISYFFSKDDGTQDFTYEVKSLPGNPGNLNLEVQGPVVWMIERGMWISDLVTVTKAPGSTNACLVIVAGAAGRANEPNNQHPGAGIWFFGGLDSDVPVFLVSDGGILNEQFQHFNNTTIASALSMYGRYVLLTGPQKHNGRTMNLAYNPALMNDLVDFLAEHGALPNVTPAIGNFALTPGSWQNLKL